VLQTALPQKSSLRISAVLRALYVKACHLLTECFVVQAGRY
jgi:hypothetical protein